MARIAKTMTNLFQAEVEDETEFGNKVGSSHIVLFVRWVDKKVLFDLMDGC